MNTLAQATANDHVGVNVVALTVLIALFTLVTVMGFMASKWRHAGMESLDEWGLGGRSFGTWVTWFLLGGDLYTAYTFIAVPAAMFALGSVNGFFAVPSTIVLYPITSSSCRACGRSATGTGSSPPRTSSATAT